MTIAMITGGTSGIGAAFARRFGRMGYDLVLVARDEERLERSAAALRERYHVEVATISADLTDPEDCRRVEKYLADEENRVDVLVNNAGFGLAKPYPHSPVDDEERMLDILTRAPLRLTHAVLPGMKARGRGAILNVASVAGLLPTGTYGAAKAWLIAFSESLRIDFAADGIKVLALCPGFTRTEFQERAGMDVSGLSERVWLDADRVVDQAIKDLRRNRPVSITGLQYRAYAVAVRLVPRTVAARMARSRTR